MLNVCIKIPVIYQIKSNLWKYDTIPNTNKINKICTKYALSFAFIVNSFNLFIRHDFNPFFGHDFFSLLFA